MAVPEQIPVVNYVANGVVKKFDVPFEYDQQSDLHLYVDGVEPTIDKYFFADNAFNFYIAPTVGQDVKIKRITPKERDTDYNLHTNTVRPKALNTDFDRLWYVLQEVFSDVGGLSQAVQDEIIARIQGDEDLLNQLTAEISARMLGDEAVTEDLKNYVNQVIGAIINDPDFDGIDAKNVNDASGETQQQVNYNGGSKWHSRVGGYKLNERVVLTNGDIVKSTIDGNTNDPNVDMTGWVYTNDASQVKYGNQNQAQINARTATPYDFGAIGDGVAHPLSERYATLAEAQAVYPSATSLDEYIDGHALNAWWLDICANNRVYATCHGDFVINTNITNKAVNSFTNPVKTKKIDFSAKVKLVGVTGIGWEMLSIRQTDRSGYLEMWDAGGTTFANRTVDILLYMEDTIHSTSSMRTNLKYARRLGMLVSSGSANSVNGTTANNNTSDLGDFQFGSCGFRFKHADFTFSSRVDIGGSNGTDQRSILTVNESLPFSNLVGGFIKFNDKPRLITANTANTITVYPWISELDTSGAFQISYGGDFELIGPDSNNIKMSNGSADCAVCAGAEGFYVGAKLQRTDEGNDIGLRLGNGVSSAQIGGTYLGTYFELNVFDLVKTSVNSDKSLIINPIALNDDKCFVLSPIGSSSRLPAPSLVNGWNIKYGGVEYGQKHLQYYDGLNPTTTIAATVKNPNFKLRANSATVTLTDELKFRELYGNVDLEFEIFGTAVNNGTSGSTTIKCQAGYTINSVAADLIIPASSSAFRISARLVNGTDWRVSIYFASNTNILRKGTTAQRPTSSATDGFVYLDTTLVATNGKPIFKSGSVWVDSTGAVV